MIEPGEMVRFRRGVPGWRRRNGADVYTVVKVEGWNLDVDDRMVLLLHPDGSVSWQLDCNLEAVA